VGWFARLRDDSPDAGAERSDVVAGLAFAAGVAGALAFWGDELDDLDLLDFLIGLFLTGVSLGFAVYWLGGWALSFVVRRLAGKGSSRRARHVLAFSFAPLVFALPFWLLWPPLLIVLAVTSGALLVAGLRETYGWSPARAGGALVLAFVWLAALGVCLLSVLALLGRV
jgi:hypothetical protein